MRPICLIRFSVTFLLVMLNACSTPHVKHPETSAEWLAFLLDTSHLMQTEYVDEVNANDLAQGAIQGMQEVTAAQDEFELLKNLEQRDKDPFEIISDAFHFIQSRSGLTIDSQSLVHGALKGIMKRIDSGGSFNVDRKPHEYGAIGLHIAKKNDRILVVAPIADSPAERAGILSCDQILKVDEQPLKDLSLYDVVEKIQGPVGTSITLTIERPAQQPFDITLTREVVKLRDVKYKAIEDSIGYIQLRGLSEHVAKDIESVLNRMDNSQIQAIVLDLRYNGGGLLNIAVDVSDQFLSKGRLVASLKSRKGLTNFTAKKGSSHPNYPLVVLVDKNTAAGAEIVAAAFQDWNRATIVGVRTFGRGSVQSLIPLRDGSHLRLTTGRLFTPNGRPIQDLGIDPDVVVDTSPLEDEPDSVSCVIPKSVGDITTDLTLKQAVQILQNK